MLCLPPHLSLFLSLPLSYPTSTAVVSFQGAFKWNFIWSWQEPRLPDGRTMELVGEGFTLELEYLSLRSGEITPKFHMNFLDIGDLYLARVVDSSMSKCWSWHFLGAFSLKYGLMFISVYALNWTSRQPFKPCSVCLSSTAYLIFPSLLRCEPCSNLF